MKAKDLLSRYWSGHIPVRPERIALSMGITISDYEGEFVVTQLREDNSIEIKLCASYSLVKKRYAIAHALGHIALGHLSKTNASIEETATSYYDNTPSKEDQKANQFATELLLPEDCLEWAIRDGKSRSLAELSALFVVSTAAMAHRLSALRFI